MLVVYQDSSAPSKDGSMPVELRCKDIVEDSTVNCPNVPSTYCGTSPGLGPVKVFSSRVLLLESDSRPVVHSLIQKFKCSKKGLSKKEF